MNTEIECPYCGFEHDDCDICSENGYEGEFECESCEKRFTYIATTYVTYSTKKAPCLNGEEHKWRKIVGYPKEMFKNLYECEYCNEERRFDNDV